MRLRTCTSGGCYCVYPVDRTSLRFDKLLEGIYHFENARILREEWNEKGDLKHLDALREALEAFSVEKITSKGAAPAVRRAKRMLAEL